VTKGGSGGLPIPDDSRELTSRPPCCEQAIVLTAQ